MNPLMKKMKFKEGSLYIGKLPNELKDVFDDVLHSDELPYVFGLEFVYELSKVNETILALDHASVEDANLWIGYPKGSSKKYKTDMKRDPIWKTMGDIGFRPVSMVSLSEDFSAMRVRKSELVK